MICRTMFAIHRLFWAFYAAFTQEPLIILPTLCVYSLLDLCVCVCVCVPLCVHCTCFILYVYVSTTEFGSVL